MRFQGGKALVEVKVEEFSISWGGCKSSKGMAVEDAGDCTFRGINFHTRPFAKLTEFVMLYPKLHMARGENSEVISIGDRRYSDRIGDRVCVGRGMCEGGRCKGRGVTAASHIEPSNQWFQEHKKEEWGQSVPLDGSSFNMHWSSKSVGDRVNKYGRGSTSV